MLGQVQALMSLLEGHGNCVMTELGRDHVAGEERMARVLHQRRNQGGMTGQLHKLLGLEQKMRQYEVGEQFVRGVGRPRRAAARSTRRGAAPEHLPTLDELDDPASWLARVEPTAPLRAEHRSRRTSRAAASALDDVDGPVVVGCSGGADSLALLALVRAAGFEASRCTSTTACGPAPSTPRSSRRAAARFGAGFRTSASRSTHGGNLEARARDARYAALDARAAEVGRRDRRRRAHAATTRPRRCC